MIRSVQFAGCGSPTGRSGKSSSRIRMLSAANIYSVCEPSPLPVYDYVAIIRVLPVAESGKAFVEWWATFDCAADERDRWTPTLQREGFAKWLAALHTFMAVEPASRTVRPA